MLKSISQSVNHCRTLFRCNRTTPLINSITASFTASSNPQTVRQRRSNYGWQIEKYFIDEEFNRDQIKFDSAMKRPIIYSPDELLIEVHAASVNPLDLLMIKGYGREIIDSLNVVNQVTRCKLSYDKFPLALGRDFSGVVRNVGANVTKFKVGDEIWGSVSPFKQGSHCKYVVASEHELDLKPTNLSFEQAASIPYVALTSWSALFKFGDFRIKDAPSKR